MSHMIRFFEQGYLICFGPFLSLVIRKEFVREMCSANRHLAWKGTRTRVACSPPLTCDMSETEIVHAVDHGDFINIHQG